MKVVIVFVALGVTILLDGEEEITSSVPVTPFKAPKEPSATDIVLAGLIKSCNDQIAIYEGLYIEYGIVLYKEDYSPKGTKLVSNE